MLKIWDKTITLVDDYKLNKQYIILNIFALYYHLFILIFMYKPIICIYFYSIQ